VLVLFGRSRNQAETASQVSFGAVAETATEFRSNSIGCFSELADIQRLSVVAVVFLYQITVFLQQNTTASLLELYFNDAMQTVYARGSAGGGSQQ